MRSDHPKVLLLGRTGQVGWELERVLAPWGALTALDRHSAPLSGDLSQADALRETLRTLAPQVIFNAAAYTAVDKAESEAQAAQSINADALAVIGEEAARLGALVVHFSTDYVFDGEGVLPYREDDVAHIAPLNTYGRTKWQGEENLRASAAEHLIFRTSWVYGVHGKNFMKTVLRLAKSRETLSMVADQMGAPTSAAFIADIASALAERVIHGERQLIGTYHLVPNGTTSWYQFARWILEQAEGTERFKLMPDMIRPISTQEFPTSARRPLNSRLDNRKLQSVLPAGAIQNWDYYAQRALGVISELL